MYQLFKPRHLRPAAGFTLIELLLTVVIVGILLAIGVPTFRTFILSQKVKSAASEISTMLVIARSEAISRNVNVVITPTGGNWQNGWAVTTTAPDGSAVTVNNHEAFATGLSVSSAATSITYAGTGRPTATATFSVQSTPATRCATIATSVSGVPTSKNVSC